MGFLIFINPHIPCISHFSCENRLTKVFLGNTHMLKFSVFWEIVGDVVSFLDSLSSGKIGVIIEESY